MKQGDTLAGVAAANDVPLSLLLSLNPALQERADALQHGDKVYVPRLVVQIGGIYTIGDPNQAAKDKARKRAIGDDAQTRGRHALWGLQKGTSGAKRPGPVPGTRQVQWDEDSYARAKKLIVALPKALPSEVEMAIHSLATLPRSTLAALEKSGCQIVLVSKMSDYLPEVTADHPAVFDWGKNVIVSKGGAFGMLCHEIGHALDAANGRPSNQPAFRAAYEADRATLEKNGESYLLQEGNSGPNEAFAACHEWWMTKPAWFKETYPALYGFWEKFSRDAGLLP